MKKSLVAVGVVVVLGAAWTGGAWYTGKKLEAHFAQELQRANEQLKLTVPEANIALSYQDYRRGLFSSRMQLVLSPLAGEGWLKPGQRVILDETVDHGPFPLAQLKSLNLLPAMASVKTTLVNNETSRPLFEIAKGETPFVVNSRIAYSGDSRSAISLKPLSYEKDSEKVSFSGGEFRFDADKEGKVFSLAGEAESGLVGSLNKYGQRVQIAFHGLKADGTSRLASFGGYTGNQKLSLENVAISVEGKEMALLEGIALDGRSDLVSDGKTINSQVDYTLDSLKVQNQDLGGGRLTLKLGQVDGTAWNQFRQQYKTRTQALMAQPELMANPEQYNKLAAEAILDSLPLLLKGEPVITIAPLSWKNAKGETALNLSLFLKDPAQAGGEAQTLTEEIDRAVKSLDAKLAIPVDMAVELMTQVGMLEGYQRKEAADMANKQVNGLAAMGQMFHLTTLDNNTISASLQYTNGQVTLNGQKMSPEEFIGQFGLPALDAPDAPAFP
ncbi:YdgA family protein [Intestinirhabdus alba]|jgi:uncharacterized protein YdgA (DUF945 family)|uniref:DUF945 family protein n=1 Tax=Intestinirhabdus alba TaxID=2899544 RepID=A0A6L6IP36_9ENTR|nr:YdgA family protein [Intestinirhabdus alba]MTH48259.1 DUF945 family protein [Intestinirhabdus alba]